MQKNNTDSLHHYWLKKIVINEQGCLFHPETGSLFITNVMGIKIIKYLQQDMTLVEMTQKVIHDYPHIQISTIEKDIFDFMGQVKQLALTECQH